MKTIKRNGVEISVEDEYTLAEGEELVQDRVATPEEEKEQGIPISKEDFDKGMAEQKEKDAVVQETRSAEEGAVPPEEPVKNPGQAEVVPEE